MVRFRHNHISLQSRGAGWMERGFLPDSEVSVLDSRSLSEASKIAAFSSLIVS